MKARRHGNRKFLRLVEALETRQMLSVAPGDWYPFAVLDGQDQEVANYPTIDGRGQTIAIIDHGIDYTHPNLDGGVGIGANNLIVYGYNFSNNSTSDLLDHDGHGTGVSGIIGEDQISYGAHYNTQGIAPGAKQILLKTGDAGDSNAEQHIKDALDWVIANHTQYNITVVNLTDFVGSGNNQPIYAAELKTINDLGIFMSSPVGNGGAGVPIGYPSANAYDYGAGGVNEDGSFYTPTQTGQALDILAPGNRVLMTYEDFSQPAGHQGIITPYAQGTSFANAHVNALAVLIKQVNPNFTPAQIMQIMQDSGTSVTDPSSGVAYKRININAAVALAFQRAGGVTPPSTDGTPYTGTPIALAATGATNIEIENFNSGAEGIAYHDLDASNVFGSSYRSGTGVDVYDTTGVSNNHLVGWTKAGEWLKYAVNVGTAGSYTLGVRTASVGLGGSFHLEVDGTPVTGTLAAPDTGSWSTFATVNGGTISLAAGQHTIRLVMDSAQQSNGYMANFDNMTLTAVTSPTPTPTPTPTDAAPTAALTAIPAVTSGTTTTFTVKYTDTDAAPVKVSTLDSSDILVTGPNGFSQLAAFVSVDTNSDGSPRTATYRITAPGGTWASTANGAYTVALQANQVSDNATPALFAAAGTLGTFTVSVAAPADGTPFSGTALAIAATGTTTVEIENFNNGAEGVAYHDLDASNVFGSTYRTGGVDIYDTAAAGNNHLVGWTKAGEWLKYAVNVTTTGTYTLGVKAASVGLGGTFHLEVDGANVTGTLAAPNTGDWTTFQNINGGNISLTVGQHTVRLVMDSAQQSNGYMANFDNFAFTAVTSPTPTPTPTPTEAAPTAALTPIATVTTGSSTTFTVKYTDTDASPVSVATLDSGDILVTGPNGFSQLATFVSVDVNADGSPRTATYRVTAPGGSWTYSANGAYTVALQANQVSDNATPALYAAAGTLGTFTVSAPLVDGTPYSGTALAVAGTGTTTVEIENFNNGAEGVAYHDLEASNVFGSNYRTGGVDVYDTTAASNNHLVGWTKAGEWMKYSVNVATAGTYALGVRAASVGLGGTFHLEVDGTPVTGTLAVPDTGGWTTFQNVNGGNISLSAGQHVIRLVMDSSQQSNGYMANFDNFALTAAGPAVPPPAPGQVASPNPASGATLSSSPAILSWTAASDAASYDVYLDGVLKANVTTTQYTVGSNLAAGAHTWQVIAKNTSGNTAGPTWNFTIAQQSTISNTNITKLAGNQVESSTTVNPTNPLNIVSVSSTDQSNGNLVIISRSTDGGSTWAVNAIGATQDHYSSTNPRVDPHAMFDAFGNLYVTYEVGIGGGQIGIVVAASSNGGVSFSSVTTAASGSDIDFPVIATGVDATNTARQAIYVAYTDYDVKRIELVSATATALGQWSSFGTPITVNQRFGTVATVAVSTTGAVAIGWQDSDSGSGPSNLYVDSSASPSINGFGNDILVTSVNVGGLEPVPAQPTRTIYASPSLAFDNSNSATNGRLFLSYVDAPTDGSVNTNIELRYSDNLGGSWSTAKQVNDDATQNSQFLPALAIDSQTGNVALSWYDARNSAGNNTVQVFAAVSTDHGLSFGANAQISKGTSDASKAQYNTPIVGTLDLGDYIGLAFSNSKIVATWADNSNSTGDNPNGATDVDIYASILSVPLA